MPNTLMTLHLWDLRAQIEAQLRALTEAQRRCESSHDAESVCEMLSYFNSALVANATIRETFEAARMEAVSLANPT